MEFYERDRELEELRRLLARAGRGMCRSVFTSGNWEPTQDPAQFTLNLSGGLASTIAFTDRPNRDFGVISTESWMPMLFTPDNPPNAAIIVEDAGVQYTFLLVLTDPAYDRAGDSITYTVSVLNAYEGEGLGPAVERLSDGTLPTSFGAGAIFIDSLGCGQATYTCINGSGQNVGTVSFDQCWVWSDTMCRPCNEYWWNFDNIGADCNNVYPDCAGTCYIETM